ncbi:DUF1033 family protein [Psychrobacillus glaciei]|uniref:DUF1033 family protein n=1 Tax=Psychrobacillus glaciei TaxID=2283160 RepID=A0A5J6SLX7_9BACI|nr:DUF1033 family protein [Psychrobacillus glaciei]QFF98935.1 DUF1033 family protein [Psychrobacillus glaciei]
MYQIIYMKADFEPWWAFEGWQEHIIEKVLFEKKDEGIAYLNTRLNELRKEFPMEKAKDDKYWAFWSVQEQCFCDYCDEDLQIYHGIIWNEIK